MPTDFGPYKWTPEDVVREIIKGREVGPSTFDFMDPYNQQQMDWEEIRRMLIERLLRKKFGPLQDPQEYPNSLWPELG